MRDGVAAPVGAVSSTRVSGGTIGATSGNASGDETDAPAADGAPATELPKLSAGAAGAALMKSMVGSGILALPWALKRFGVASGVAGLLVLAVINVVAIRLLIACRVRLFELEGERTRVREDVGTATLVPVGEDDDGIVPNPYEMVARRAVGPHFARACTCALVAAQLGVVTAYLDVVTVTALVLVPWCPREAVLAALWLGLSVAGLLRGLSEVSWLALAGLSCYLFVIAALVRYGMPRLRERGASDLELFDPSGFGWWYGIAMFAFEGIGTVLPILEEMRTLARPEVFHAVVHTSYLTAFCFYVLVGGVGYVAYGSETADVILFNFPPSLLTTLTTRSMAAMMLFSGVVQIYPIHRIADGLARARFPSGGGGGSAHVSTGRRFALRALVTLVPAGIACVAPNVSTVVDLVGASCFSFLGVLAPVAMYLRLFADEVPRSQRALLWLLGAFGLLGGAIGTLSPFVMDRRR